MNIRKYSRSISSFLSLAVVFFICISRAAAPDCLAIGEFAVRETAGLEPLHKILNEISAVSGAELSTAHEKLRRFIARPEGVNDSESAVIENALGSIIEKDLKNVEAHISFSDLCEKKGDIQKAFYHIEMAAMADPYNFGARRRLNFLREKLSASNEPAVYDWRNVLNAKAGVAAAGSDASFSGSSLEVDIINSSAAAENQRDDIDTIAVEDRLSSTVKKNVSVLEKREAVLEVENVLRPDVLKNNACYYITRKDYGRAADSICRVLESDPSDNEANYLMAYIKNNAGKNKEAILYLNSINPETVSDARLLHDIGVLWVRLKKNEEAVVFFTNGIVCDRNFIDNYISLAVYYTQIKDYDSAAKYFEEAMSIEPRNEKLIYYYALSSNKAGNYDKFISLSDTLLKISPDGPYSKMIKRRLGFLPTDRLISYDNEKILLNVAIAYFNEGDYARAELKLKEIVKIDPASFEANLYLARGAKNRRDMFEYIYYLLRLDSIKYDPAVILELARAFAVLGLNVISREFYTDYINKNLNDIPVRFEYAEMLSNRGAPISARVIAESAIRNAKNESENKAANLIISNIAGAYGDSTDETGFIKFEAEDNETLYKLFSILHENQMYKAIEKTGDILIANEIQAEPRVMELYSFALSGLKKYNRAAGIYKKIIASDRSNYNAYFQLGRIYMKRNNFVRAEEYFRAANVFKPQEPEILMSLGDSCYYQKNLEDAELAYREAFECAPNPVIKDEIKLKLDKIRFKKRGR